MALSDYLPYGAPELIEGASTRLARSTMTASVGVMFLVVVFGAVLTHGFTRSPEQIVDLGSIEFLPPLIHDPPQLEVRTPRIAPQSRQAFEPDRIPRPVPDPQAPPDDSKGPVLPDSPVAEGPDHSTSLPSGRIDGIAVARDPEPNEFVPVDEYPVPIRCSEARYPDLARSAGVEGTVRVLMLLGLNGHVERAIIAPKGSVPMLDAVALEAARTCVFTPALANGHPVKVWVSQNYRFSLH